MHFSYRGKNSRRFYNLLEKIQPGSAKRFADNIRDQIVNIDAVNSFIKKGEFHIALESAFTWAETKEGSHYWMKIHEELARRYYER